MAKIIRLVWGVLPFMIVSLCLILISMFERVTGDTLRILSRNLLILLWVLRLLGACLKSPAQQ